MFGTLALVNGGRQILAIGRIKDLKFEKGFGFISPETGGKDVFFHKNSLQDFEFSRLQIGMIVEFEWEKGQRGPRANFVRCLAHNEQPHEYRFINPYNFVSYLSERPQNIVLGNCPTPPHDRYFGWTGRITCNVKAVTPLFISDTHAISEDNTNENRQGINKHKIYRFFEYEGKPALPASSLRGMIRSVFEAVTNSCFVAFQTDSPYPLEYRTSRAPKEMIPARVLEINDKGEAQLERLDCSINPPVQDKISNGRPFIKAGIIDNVYYPNVLKLDRVNRDLQNNYSDGMRVAALVKKEPKDKGHYQYFEVIKIAPVADYSSLVLEQKKSSENCLVFGWLHLTGPNIENKHSERLFFRWDDKTPEAPQQIPNKYLYKCSAEIVEEYKHHLSEYWERHEQRIKKLGSRRWPNSTNNLPHPSNFITKGNKLKVGDLVYLVRERGKEMLRPIAMPRLRYTYHRQHYLPKFCEDYNQLCPACRVFGWVRKGDKNSKLQNPTAYAGRVRFSHGIIKKPWEVENETTLAILSTPKPSTTEFYLLDSSGNPDRQVNYDTANARLRGRKFYHHHDQPKDYATDQKSDQNRTIRGALKPCATFTFDIEFENLSSSELGALIYSLELEDGMYHRLGYGKPLGFGSVKITIEKIETIDWSKRLISIEPKAGCEGVKKERISELRKMFLDEIRNIYGDEEYNNLQSELKAILGKQNLPIHYPRPTSKPNPNKPSFEWFVGNKRRKEHSLKRAVGTKQHKEKLPEPVALPLATDVEKGLPLIDKSGMPGR